jgi:hypothetical protein
MIIAYNIKNYYRVLLQRYYLQPFLTKVTLLLLKGVATNMALLQPYFTVAIDQFSTSACYLNEPCFFVICPYETHAHLNCS